MAEPKTPPQAEFESLAELGRVLRKQRLDEWNRRHKGEPQPTEQDLRNLGVYLIDNPELIGGRYDYYIWLALKCLVKKIPDRPFRPKVTAAMVDMFVDAGVLLGDARQKVADRSKKTVEAVKQAHLRHGKRKRDKPR